jgi:hypothetical protein
MVLTEARPHSIVSPQAAVAAAARAIILAVVV